MRSYAISFVRVQSFTYHQVLRAFFPLLLVWHDDFSIYLADTCLEYWETERLQTERGRCYFISVFHRQHYGIRTFARQKTNTFRALLTCYILREEGANKNTSITQDYSALFCPVIASLLALLCEIHFTSFATLTNQPIRKQNCYILTPCVTSHIDTSSRWRRQ